MGEIRYEEEEPKEAKKQTERETSKITIAFHSA